MRVGMMVDSFNELMAFASPFIAKEDYRPALTRIYLEADDAGVKATALDGYKLGQIALSATCEEPGSLLIPVVKKMKRDEGFVHIYDEESSIVYETATGKQVFKKLKDRFIDYRTVQVTEPGKEVFKIGVDNLRTALSAFDKSDTVQISYHGAIKPLVIETAGKYAMVLPCR